MQRVLRNSAFRAWDFDTSFIQKHAAELLRERTENAREVALAATIRIAYERSRREQAGNPWLTFDGFRLNHEARRKIEFVRKSRDEDTEVHALVVYKAGENPSVYKLEKSTSKTLCSNELLGTCLRWRWMV